MASWILVQQLLQQHVASSRWSFCFDHNVHPPHPSPTMYLRAHHASRCPHMQSYRQDCPAFKRYTGLLKRHSEDVREVALLTPYRAQLGVLRRAALRELEEKALLNVTFATIDGFQVTPLIIKHQHQQHKMQYLMAAPVHRTPMQTWFTLHMSKLYLCWLLVTAPILKQNGLLSRIPIAGCICHSHLQELSGSAASAGIARMKFHVFICLSIHACLCNMLFSLSEPPSCLEWLMSRILMLR